MKSLILRPYTIYATPDELNGIYAYLAKLRTETSRRSEGKNEEETNMEIPEEPPIEPSCPNSCEELGTPAKDTQRKLARDVSLKEFVETCCTCGDCYGHLESNYKSRWKYDPIHKQFIHALKIYSPIGCKITYYEQTISGYILKKKEEKKEWKTLLEAKEVPPEKKKKVQQYDYNEEICPEFEPPTFNEEDKQREEYCNMQIQQKIIRWKNEVKKFKQTDRYRRGASGPEPPLESYMDMIRRHYPHRKTLDEQYRNYVAHATMELDYKVPLTRQDAERICMSAAIHFIRFENVERCLLQMNVSATKFADITNLVRMPNMGSGTCIWSYQINREAQIATWRHILRKNF